ncbi:hypothetical protein GF337_07560 [candidate division KSB1 bacterium]|nr:hypothetical protein [candidate division KSB1 bacterium]
MKLTNCCEYCRIPFKKGEKPFVPVNGTSAYHWNCYFKSLKIVDIDECEEEYEESYLE